jgi:hypothetical protein
MNTSVIIPIHEYNDNVLSLVKKSINSVFKQENVNTIPEIIVVGPKEVIELLSSVLNTESIYPQIRFITNFGNIDYQSQVNLAVDLISTEYFSVLEFDDEYANTYFKNVEKYTKSYPEVDIFLTMMIEVNDENHAIKLTNETVWAQQFIGENGEMGYLNLNALKQYTDFKLSGAIIKTSEFKNIGKYKTNIKLTFMYEFLLRALNNACKIYSIPKIGYKHLASRDGSMFSEYLRNMSVVERKFWFETANKESNFTTDRLIDLSKITKIVE